MANIKKRTFPGNETQDLGAIGNLTYNNPAGAQKVAEVGRNLLPLATPGAGNGYTTTVTTAVALPTAGCNVAVYNNSAAINAITFGSDNTVSALGAGVTSATGQVGLPCTPNAWSYFAAGNSNWVIASSASLFVFLINDSTSIQVQSAANAST